MPSSDQPPLTLISIPYRFEKLKLPSYGQMPGVAFHCSDVQVSANGPRVLVFGGQRQGITNTHYSFEKETGEGFLLVADSAEGTGPPPDPRTQATFTSYGPEPQTQLLLFAGFVLNIGCVNDLWRCTIGLDALSMPVPTWEKLDPTGEPPSPRYGHSATLLSSIDSLVVFAGQDETQQFNDLHLFAYKTNVWSQPSVSGTPPIVRSKHTANAYSPNALLVFGGFSRTERVMADAYR
jgi:hypothetical protein